jgi:hypothetical protein
VCRFGDDRDAIGGATTTAGAATAAAGATAAGTTDTAGATTAAVATTTALRPRAHDPAASLTASKILA